MSKYIPSKWAVEQAAANKAADLALWNSLGWEPNEVAYEGLASLAFSGVHGSVSETAAKWNKEHGTNYPENIAELLKKHGDKGREIEAATNMPNMRMEELSDLQKFIKFLRAAKDDSAAVPANAKAIAEFFGVPLKGMKREEVGHYVQEILTKAREKFTAMAHYAEEQGREVDVDDFVESMMERLDTPLSHWSEAAATKRPTVTYKGGTASEEDAGIEGVLPGGEDVETRQVAGEGRGRRTIEALAIDAGPQYQASLDAGIKDLRKRLLTNIPAEARDAADQFIQKNGITKFLQSLEDHLEFASNRDVRGVPGYLKTIQTLRNKLNKIEVSQLSPEKEAAGLAALFQNTSSGGLFPMATEIGHMGGTKTKGVAQVYHDTVSRIVSGKGPADPLQGTVSPGQVGGVASTVVDTAKPTEEPTTNTTTTTPPTDPSVKSPGGAAKEPAPTKSTNPPKDVKPPAKPSKLWKFLKDNFIGDEKQRAAMSAIMEGGVSRDQIRGAVTSAKNVQSKMAGPRLPGEVSELVDSAARKTLKSKGMSNLWEAGTSPLAMLLLSFAPGLVTQAIKGVVSPFASTDQQKDIEASGALDPMSMYLQKRVQQSSMMNALGSDPATHEDFNQEYSTAYNKQIAQMGDVPGRRYYGSAQPSLSAMDLLGLAKLRGGSE